MPLGAVTGKIMVTTADGSATSAATLTVVQPPRATSFAPAAAVVDTLITVTGTNMAGATLVTFTGGATAVPSAVTATSLKVVVPEGALTGPVSVTNPIGTAPSAASFKVLPKITDVTPLSAVGGSATVITVSGFNLKVGATTPGVKIGAFVVPLASITSSATQLTFPVPLGAVTGKIMVTTADGSATSAATLTVVQPPRATSFAPAAAVVGTLITVTGTNMTGATLVTFTGGATAAPTVVTGATSLKVVVPEGALTGPVSVTNPTGTAPSAASFKVLPKITGFAPSSVTAGSATVVTVDGFNLKVGATTPTVKVGTLVIRLGLISVSTVDAGRLHGAGEGAVGQDHDHDGGRDGHQRDVTHRDAVGWRTGLTRPFGPEYSGSISQQEADIHGQEEALERATQEDAGQGPSFAGRRGGEGQGRPPVLDAAAAGFEELDGRQQPAASGPPEVGAPSSWRA